MCLRKYFFEKDVSKLEFTQNVYALIGLSLGKLNLQSLYLTS